MLKSAVRRAGKSRLQRMPNAPSSATSSQYPAASTANIASKASAMTAPPACVTSSRCARDTRSATMPANGPSTINGADRANAATATMNGEPVIWSAIQPTATRSIHRAMLLQRPDTQRRR